MLCMFKNKIPTVAIDYLTYKLILFFLASLLSILPKSKNSSLVQPVKVGISSFLQDIRTAESNSLIKLNSFSVISINKESSFSLQFSSYYISTINALLWC